MFRTRKIAIATVLAAGAFAAQAADFFVGGSLGASHYHTEDIGGVHQDRNDVGLKAFGGAMFTPNFGIEAGYANLGKVKATAGNVTGSLRGTGFYLDGVGEFPVGGNFSLLAKVGVFRGELKAEVPGYLDDKDTGTDIKLGFGASYAITKNLSVRAEWERFRFNAFDDKGDADLFSVGMRYRF